MLRASVAGLYIPPGEILVGGSGEFGRIQMVPCSSRALGADVPFSEGAWESLAAEARARRIAMDILLDFMT
jgi:hypothetical protein